MSTGKRLFVIARNPDQNSRLPYLLAIPLSTQKTIILATGDTWPSGKDLYCHPIKSWPEEADILEKLPVQSCWRKGKAVHLVLERRSMKRSMFVWTENRKGRTLVFWRSPRSMKAARPAVRVPKARGLSFPITVAVDTRERYPWTFKNHGAKIIRAELRAGDYGVLYRDKLVAVVERKSSADLATSAVDGKLGFALQELSTIPFAAVVIEGRLSDLVKNEHVRPGWLLNLVVTLQMQFPRITWVFAETRKLAEDYAYRFLAAAKKFFRESPAETDVRPEERSIPVTDLDSYGRRAAAAALAREGRIWTTRKYAEHFQVSRSAALSDLKALTDNGVLRAEGNTRKRRYISNV